MIDHILKHGHITTEELKNKYGYDHPPRAARDVRELGIQLETFRVEAANGRKIAAYRFADPTKKQFRRFSGRTGLSKEIKEQLVKKYGCQCFIYLEKMDAANLQIDHRVPYEVAGDDDELKTNDFMLLCGSANRAKSWSCEHCENWKSIKDKNICLSCYWAYPEKHTHVAMRQIRRIDLVWQGEEIAQYEKLKTDAAKSGLEIPQFVKGVLAKVLK
ncbi:MAG TPA: HNH endonuclease [Verrucomicrobiae bacterium]|nr:HNH endonuclease [Verrucomicrobiae bacterium]